MIKIIILILMLSTPCFGATYYIDQSATDDTDNGTSKSTPWKRCPGMVGFAGSYSHSAGDVFIFKGGETWTTTELPLTIGYSGSSGSPDKYTVDKTWYTGGSWTRPLFDANRTDNYGIYAEGKDYVEIYNIEVDGALQTGIRCKSGSNYRISECKVTNCGDYLYVDDWSLMHHGAITLDATIAALDDSIVESCEVIGNEIGIYAGSFAGAHAADDIYVVNNYVKDAGQFGILIAGELTNVFVLNNNVIGSGNASYCNKWGVGISVLGTAGTPGTPSDVLIRGNYVYDTDVISAGTEGDSGVGIVADTASSDVLMVENIVVDSESSALSFSGNGSNGMFSNLVINANTTEVQDCQNGGATGHCGAVYSKQWVGGAGINFIVNNTIITTYDGIFNNDYSAQFPNVIQNNIVYSETGQSFCQKDDESTEAGGNLFHESLSNAFTSNDMADADWNTFGTVTTSEEASHDGRSDCRSMTLTQGSNGGIRSDDYSVSNDALVKVSFWAKIVSGALTVRVNFKDDSSEIYLRRDLTTTNVGTDWEQYFFYYHEPNAAGSGSFLEFCNDWNNQAAVVYLDNVVIDESTIDGTAVDPGFQNGDYPGDLRSMDYQLLDSSAARGAGVEVNALKEVNHFWYGDGYNGRSLSGVMYPSGVRDQGCYQSTSGRSNHGASVTSN